MANNYKHIFWICAICFCWKCVDNG